MTELKPCPFCGGKVYLQITDSEGNFHDKDYEENPWSGLGYVYVHPLEENENCPIARLDGGQLGAYIYYSKEEAIEEWNKRVSEDYEGFEECK